MADSGPSEREELRFAVVLNGGVSLAVWMGGVVAELDALVRRRGGYGTLMGLLDVKARADVISGTSAGGINGAALALSQVNERADLSLLRTLWAEQGRMETLLQRPFHGEPGSLLRGEDYFLPELTAAMRRLAADWAPTPIEDHPVDLTITTTLLDGALWETTDGFGQRLTQRRHDGRFHFVRMVTDAGERLDQFSEPALAPDDVASRLGLAARASAGFPVAFEATYIPVDAPAGAAGGDGRPDMAAHATWRASTGPAGSVSDRSRYAVDGGLLANTPTKHALEAVQRMRADGPVERVMTLVAPRGAGDKDSPAARGDTPPTLLGTGLGIVSALTSQGNRSFVDEVEEHNRRVQSRRGTRAEVLASIGEGPMSAADVVEGLRSTADVVFPYYRDLRRRRAGRDVAAGAPHPEGWSDSDVLEAIDANRSADGVALTYVPEALAAAGKLPAVPRRGGTWAWGWETVLDIADIALDYLGALGRVWPADPAALGRAREQVHDAAAHARGVRDAFERVWVHLPASLSPPEYVALRRAAYQWLVRDDRAAAAMVGDLEPGSEGAAALAELGRDVLRMEHEEPAVDDVSTALADAGGAGGRVLASAAAALLDAVVSISTTPLTAAQDAALRTLLDAPWRRLLEVATVGDARRRTWSLLLGLHVVSWTVGDELPTGNTREVRLALVSALTENHFATSSRTIEDKLGGSKLSRFSGFLKQSWRMNDWTWGRCDAATMLTRVLVTPERVRAYAIRSGQVDASAVVDDLFGAALGLPPGAGQNVPELGEPLAALRTDAVGEVAALLAAEAAAPAVLAESDREQPAVVLRALSQLLAYPRHALIAYEELPAIAASIRADRADGASPGTHGELFLAENARLLTALQAPPPVGTAEWLTLGVEALRAFDRAGIGREPLEREAASDQVIRTAMTSAAVVATVLDGPHSGLSTPVTRPATRALRGLMLLPYWVTRGLTATGSVARYLGLLGLAVGGVLLVLSVLGLVRESAAGVAALLGGGALLTAIAYAALRAGSHLHAGVLLGALALLGVLGLRSEEAHRGVGAFVVGVLVVVGLIVLGSLPVRVQVPEDDVVVPGGRRLPAVLLRRLAVLVLAAGYGIVAWAAASAAGVGAVAPVGVVVGGLVAVAVLLAFGLAARHRLALGRWQGTVLRPYVGAAAATGRWSIAYGLVALALAIGALGWWLPDERTVEVWLVVAGLAVFALGLLWLVPWAAPRSVRARIRSTTYRQALVELHSVVPIGTSEDVARREVVRWLVERDRAYRFLVKHPTSGVLTRAGATIVGDLADPAE